MTDHSIVTAAFGLARLAVAAGDIDAAIQPLDEVPATSRHFNTARATAIIALVHGRPTSQVTREQIIEAAQCGVNGYIIKPFTAVTLKEKLDKVFERLAQAA